MTEADSMAATAMHMANMMWRADNKGQNPKVSDAEEYLALIAKCVRALKGDPKAWIATR